MQILALSASPRGLKSQTRVLTEDLLTAARSEGAETELIDLCKIHIGFCQACEACHQGPDCVLHDDGKTVLGKLLNADGFVLASPVYLSQVTAQMKALLDRSSHFIHCLRLMGKYMAVVTTSGGGGGTAVHTYLRNYAMTVGAQCVGGVDAAVPLKERDHAAAAQTGQALCAAIRDGTVYADQAQEIEDKKRYFGRLIAMRQDHWPYEYRYWREKGWL